VDSPFILPGDGKGKYSVIVARTPYDKSKGGKVLAANAAQHGNALVAATPLRVEHS
jgi:hypothetical protein